MMEPREKWAAYRDLFSSALGQKVLQDLRRAFGHEYVSTIDAESPYKTYASEGQRTVIVYIRRILDADEPPDEGPGDVAELDPQPEGDDRDVDNFDAIGQ